MAAVLALQRSAGNAAVTRVLQRRVGFEFQCRNWEFVKQDRKGGETVLDPFDPGRGNPVAENAGWHLESDGGEPEFIVDAVEESNHNLRLPMQRIETFARSFGNRGGREIPNYFQDHRKKLLIRPKDGGAPEAPVTADPQVTAGVRYDRLATFMSVISQRVPAEGNTPERRLTGGNALVQNRAVQHYKRDDLMIGQTVPAVRQALTHLLDPDRYRLGPRDINLPAPQPAAVDDAGIEGVVGILALLATYLRKAPELGHALRKDMPLLAKSDLGTAIRSSPLYAWMQPGQLQTSILQRLPSGYDAVADPLARLRTMLEDVLLESAGRGLDEPVYTGAGDAGGPTIRQWLDALFTLQPRDLLSSRNTDFADPSMGPWNRVDQVGPQNARSAAPIVEMRRITNAMSADEWTQFAIRVADWLARVNNPATGSAGLDI